MNTMNPVFKQWILQSLQKAAGSGGMALFDEILDTVSTDVLMRLQASIKNILLKRANSAQVVDHP